jgi:hypothetical protein
MSNDNKGPNAKPQNVTSLPERCPAPECKKGIARMHFCEEHFIWYKEGLINKRGQKASDFDKKYQNYMRKKAA